MPTKDDGGTFVMHKRPVIGGPRNNRDPNHWSAMRSFTYDAKDENLINSFRNHMEQVEKFLKSEYPEDFI